MGWDLHGDRETLHGISLLRWTLPTPAHCGLITTPRAKDRHEGYPVRIRHEFHDERNRHVSKIGQHVWTGGWKHPQPAKQGYLLMCASARARQRVHVVESNDDNDSDARKAFDVPPSGHDSAEAVAT